VISMHITKPHCTCLLLPDRKHAGAKVGAERNGKSFISGAPQALEHTDLPIPTSTACPAVPTSVAADRSRIPHTLVQYWLRMRRHSWRHRATREAALGLTLAELGEKTMNVKSMIVLAAVVAAVALGACRWEEYRPLKLGAGADMPVAEKTR
jgi:hypothetical protein